MLHDDTFIDGRAASSLFSGILRGMPFRLPKMLCALDMLLAPSRQCVIAADARPPIPRAGTSVRRKFEPIAFPSRRAHGIQKAWQPIDGKAALYLQGLYLSGSVFELKNGSVKRIPPWGGHAFRMSHF